jgi:bifunctional UDP-N-acetylglucosamine pyrophosphorylase/glucosamine-1-phosphate N-acetyltransferase
VKNKDQQLDVLILAAGLGTRMRSNKAKVLHEIDGRPLIAHVCHAAAALGPRKIYVVVGHQAEEVKMAVLQDFDPNQVEFVLQKEQLGTGDAVNSAREDLKDSDSNLMILSGDVPLIRPETLAGLLQLHLSATAACSILTVKLDDPTGYGRVIRDAKNSFAKIVEQKDATDQERAVNEINSGIYCFNSRLLFAALANVKPSDVTGEYYLTDVPGFLSAAGETVSLYVHTDVREVSGINNRVELAGLEKLIRRRTISRLMLDSGATFIDPKSCYVSSTTKIGKDTVVYPNVTIEGESVIGAGCIIRSGTRITNSTVGDNVIVLDNCVITDSEVGDSCAVGPMAHLRGHAVMKEKAKVGNFTELKKTELGKNSKANHLTYLGDATIGDNTNIGAGTITCNYDGKNKHATKIGNNVKIGSDTMLVAPIEVGDGAVTGAGTVATKNIAPHKLVVGAPARAIKTLKQQEETGDKKSVEA